VRDSPFGSHVSMLTTRTQRTLRQTLAHTRMRTRACAHAHTRMALMPIRMRRCVVADMPPAVRDEVKEVKGMEEQKRKAEAERLVKDAVV
jgi:hypothetical protein